MSRSRRRPFIALVGKCKARAMKRWKRQTNQDLRRELVDLLSDWGNNKVYRFHSDIWDSPRDGGRGWIDKPENRRK